MNRVVLACALGTVLSLALVASGCGSGGAATGSGGSTGSGGAATGSGGSTGSGGTTAGSGGSTGSGGANMDPLTLTACTTQVRGATCTPDQNCAKTCGPDRTGRFAETCSGGLFVDGSCVFPTSASYACYKLVSPVPACPAGTTSSGACTAPACTPCGDPVGTGYVDSTNTAKQGFCVCTAGTWSCASVKGWPCYSSTGGALSPGCN